MIAKYSKLLYFDLETTGLDERLNEPYQFAFLVEINKNIVAKKVFYAQPINWDTIKLKALETSGVTLEQLKTYPMYQVTYIKIKNFLTKYIDPYNKADKFSPVGYNVGFDIRFLNSWFKKCQDNYLFSFLDPKNDFDVLSYIKLFNQLGIINKMENNKLVTVCKSFNIPLNKAHDALEDIEATRKIFKKCMNVFDLFIQYINNQKIEIVP